MQDSVANTAKSSNKQPENRACRACATAKAKCIRQDESHGKCERRVAQLESKLDSIVTLLASTQSNQNAYLSPESSQSEAREPLRSQNSGGYVPALNKTSSTETAVPEALGSSDFILGVPLQEAERLLRLFKKDLAVQFPFVIVPDESVENLHRQRPVLVMAIIVAASFRSLSQQRQLAGKLLEYLSLHIVLQGEKSLDLLQGLLILASWHNFVLSAINGIQSISAVSRQLANEERRALLGCFYVTSVISACFRKSDAVRYTSYTEDCAQVLLGAGEHQSDIGLVAQVRLQHIIEGIGQSLPFDESRDPKSPTPPIGLCIKSFLAELQSVQSTLLNLCGSTSLSLHYHIVEIHLYEIGLSETHNAAYGAHVLSRLEIIYACLTALKSFFEVYNAIPTHNYYSLPLFEWTQFAYAVIVLSKLTFLQEDFWDTPFTQQTLDLLEILNQAAVRFEQAEKTVTVDGMPIEENGLFSRWARKIRWVKAWYETKLPSGARLMNGSTPAMQPTGMLVREDDALLVDELLAGGLLQDMDDATWQQLMGDWGGAPFGV
ncbi:hypothetical protein MMC26_000650 [Xylographa opegraphella]|nr:hypothetical protein [Xylographa opegraphella]